ncbi:hypothetical protein BDC45DRAFT_416974, partial [Circinella umbellata]
FLNEQGQEASSYVEEKSFRLKRLTDLKKYVKKQDVQIEIATSEDIEMEEVPPKKEISLEYNVYTDEDRRRYFYF